MSNFKKTFSLIMLSLLMIVTTITINAHDVNEENPIPEIVETTADEMAEIADESLTITDKDDETTVSQTEVVDVDNQEPEVVNSEIVDPEIVEQENVEPETVEPAKVEETSVTEIKVAQVERDPVDVTNLLKLNYWIEQNGETIEPGSTINHNE